ncbi:hypothetical protein IWT140_01052 [Secundilactobacillus pentosiphilus]|uniref:Surface layer protein A domain-containing protein n=1 Tax=Secundilactobacillus pentosiphilus TaxID=1714682 RepID=A0A1Z5INW8_9LACO|nr:FlxA-like family protein [Secundilactobacillus pentosiphilus]GAX03449.1 hypothetical protein IWT140_01052 [Secundilactobacillus pentosiphilus]
MNFLGKTAILGLSVTCLGAVSSVQTAQASTKVQYKNLKATQYTVVKGSKGYMYKDATLKHKLHSVKSYSKEKFIVSKEAIVKKANGKKTVYYRIKSGKVSGWIWHGYLAKVSVKKSRTTQNTDLQQQIADLQKQISNLKNQVSSSTSTMATSTTSTNDSAQIANLQNQINSLKSSENASGSTNTSNTKDNATSNAGDTGATHPDDVDKEATTDPVFNGAPTEYYLDSTDKIYLYPDSQAKKYPTLIQNNGDWSTDKDSTLKSLPVYAKNEKSNDANMLPVKYNGQKGYVDADVFTTIPVNELFYKLGDKPDFAGYGNMAPTDVKISNPLADHAIWTQYSKDAKYGNTIRWNYNAITKAWTKD